MIPVILYDRFLMAFSLGVHIILASLGMTVPIVMVVAEVLGIRRKDQPYTVLAKRLSRMFIILFAVGTASGVLVASELYLLWPPFMALIGQTAILTIYIEVFAFFLESIFLAVYVYGWDRFRNRYVHALIGMVVAVGGAASAVLITMLNAFMNTPSGFNIQQYLATGSLGLVNPFQALATPSTLIEVSHVMVTTYFMGSFLLLSYFAYRVLKSQGPERQYYRKGLKITMSIVIIATALSAITGPLSISNIYAVQPEKYAALEANIAPMTHAPERIFGTYANGSFTGGLLIPDLQSILATGSPSGLVPGLDQFPRNTWPPLIVHDFFDVVVGLGFLFALFALVIVVMALLKKSPLDRPVMLKGYIAATVLAVALYELGWAMAEIGRQPWIIYNVMTVSQAANTSPSVIPIAIAYIALYTVIVPLTVFIIAKVLGQRPLTGELEAVQ